MKTRTLVIGDIHGADLALQQAMERANVTHKDTVICLGDYVDGWSGSSAVINRLIRLNETNDCIFIKGNHDVWCEEWLDNEASNVTWLYNGGEATLSSYDHFSRDEKQLHLRFFQRMRGYYIDGKNRLFLHAGFSSMHGPAHETYPSNFSWDRTLWEAALTGPGTGKIIAVLSKALKAVRRDLHRAYANHQLWNRSAYEQGQSLEHRYGSRLRRKGYGSGCGYQRILAERSGKDIISKRKRTQQRLKI
jgi:calcineurin-like phosphoesterase family protein